MGNRSYASYAEPPRAAESAQAAPRRPYAFSQQARQPQQGYGYDANYAQQAYQQAYARQNGGYAQQQAYQQEAAYGQQQAYQQQSYTQQQSYAQQQTKLLLVHPDRFEVAADIADRIRERNAIVLNLESTQKDTTRRILDFLSGVTYALGGKVKRVAGNTYIITPAGMDFLGDSIEEQQPAAPAYF
ncbi:MAG: cell division protein SepF [Oscillospiraceae bacterium]|nr:cell division protein SepF [Oscillospiraceae bacterium]